jgi:hypothetical protein
MAMSNFPPQAYTRDVLAAAYEWVRKQPLSTRELAQDSNTLVALYMQARRRGQIQNQSHLPAGAQANPSPSGVMISTQAPMSPSTVESFKQELKTLTEGLKQFEEPESAEQASTSTQSLTSADPEPERTTMVNQPCTNQFSLDAHSMQTLHQVKNKLNLSSDSESLRLLIAIGFDKIREILPKS